MGVVRDSGGRYPLARAMVVWKLGLLAVHPALEDGSHPLLTVHRLDPRDAKDQPVVEGGLVVAPAVTHDLVALGVELVAVALDDDAQIAVDQVRVDRPSRDPNGCLRLQPETGHPEGDAADH